MEGYFIEKTQERTHYLEVLRLLHGKLQGILETYGETQGLDENKHTPSVPLSTGWEVQVDAVSPEDARMGYETSSCDEVHINPIEIYLTPRAAEDSDNDADCEVAHLCEDDNILFVIGTDSGIEESNDCAKLTAEQLAGIAADMDDIVIPWLAAQADATSESA